MAAPAVFVFYSSLALVLVIVEGQIYVQPGMVLGVHGYTMPEEPSGLTDGTYYIHWIVDNMLNASDWIKKLKADDNPFKSDLLFFPTEEIYLDSRKAFLTEISPTDGYRLPPDMKETLRKENVYTGITLNGLDPIASELFDGNVSSREFTLRGKQVYMNQTNFDGIDEVCVTWNITSGLFEDEDCAIEHPAIYTTAGFQISSSPNSITSITINPGPKEMCANNPFDVRLLTWSSSTEISDVRDIFLRGVQDMQILRNPKNESVNYWAGSDLQYFSPQQLAPLLDLLGLPPNTSGDSITFPNGTCPYWNIEADIINATNCDELLPAICRYGFNRTAEETTLPEMTTVLSQGVTETSSSSTNGFNKTAEETTLPEMTTILSEGVSETSSSNTNGITPSSEGSEYADCVGKSSAEMLADGECVLSMERISNLTSNLNKSSTTDSYSPCIEQVETKGGTSEVADSLISTLASIVSDTTCQPKENLTKFVDILEVLTPYLTLTNSTILAEVLSIIKFVVDTGIENVMNYSSDPSAGTQIAKVVFGSLDVVITEIYNYTLPSSSKATDEIFAELNCTQPVSNISDDKIQSILKAKKVVADSVIGILEGFLFTLQRLSGSNIQIDVPPFYVSFRSMKLRDLPGFYQCPYGSIDVSSVSTVNTSVVTVQDNVIAMFTGFSMNIFGGNSSSSGMANSVVRLDIYSPGGVKLTDFIQTESEVEIKTREDKIKAATACSASTLECDNTTSYSSSDGMINKESHSMFYVSPESNNLRLDVDRNETYEIYVSSTEKPSDTKYDLYIQRDQLSNIWLDEGIDSENEEDAEPPSWELEVKFDGNKLFMYIASGNDTGDNSTSMNLHVVVQQSVVPGEGDMCDYISPSATNIDIVSYQGGGKGYEPMKTQVSPDSTKEKTKFKSNFLGTFTVDLFYPPNTIDFSSVFEDFASKVADNWLVLGTIVVMLAISISLGIWMRWLDKRDSFMWEFQPLEDNAPWHTHSYKLSIQVGTKGDILTNQKVQMKIVGENGFSGPRVLDDGQRKNFKKGSMSNFLMTTFGDLGELHKIEFWLEDFEQPDPTKRNKGINQWNPNINNSNNLDSEDMNRNNSNNINSEPNKRKQLKKLHISKVSVADVKKSERYFFDCNMTIDNSGKYQNNQSVPLAMESSVKNFWFLFNNHAKRGIFDDHLWLSTFKRPSVSHFTRLQRLGCCVSALFLAMVASCMWYKTEENSPNVGVEIGPFRLTWHAVYTGTLVTLMVLPVNMGLVFVFQKVKAKESDLSIESSRGKKKFALPRWFLIPAWIVLILSVLVSGFFTFLYSIEWGKETSTDWLVSQIVGTLENILLFQSIKVFLLAIFLALVLRLPSDPVDSNDVTVPRWRPPDDPDKAKRESDLDKKMFTNIGNIILSLAYIILLLFIAFSAMDPRGFFQNQHIRNTLLGQDDSYKIETFTHMYAWLRNVVVPYNTGFSLNKMHELADDDFYQLAPLRMKQVRYPDDLCFQPPIMNQVTRQNCNGLSRMYKEDQDSYGIGWSKLTQTVNTTTQDSYFIHRAPKDVQGVPTTGYFSHYTGGGFVADLSMDYNTSLSIIDELVKLNWVTGRTKAVIIESTLFNGNINLFALVKLICEKTELGRVFVYPRIQSFRLYTYVGTTGILVISCQVLWLLLLLYFIIQECIAFKKQKCKYFKDLWNVAHAVHLFLAMASIGLYLARIPYIIDAVERVHNEHGTFVSFDTLAFWDEAFTITLSFVLFLALLEMLRYFQFIKQLANFLATIRFSINSIMAYSIVFGVAFWAYSFLGYLWLGSTVESFSQIITSAETLMSTMLGKMSKDLVSFESNTVGMIYFMSYVVVIGFILVDMFISIMTDTYEYIKDHPEMSPYDEELAHHMSMRFKGLFRSLFGGKDNPEAEKKKKKKGLDQRESGLVNRLEQLSQGLDTSHHVNWDRFMIAACEIIKDEKGKGPAASWTQQCVSTAMQKSHQKTALHRAEWKKLDDYESMMQKMHRPDYYGTNMRTSTHKDVDY